MLSLALAVRDATLLSLAVVLGVVEGITEFVPVSSTGHLILVGAWLSFPEDKAPAFEIFIQLGAVLALVWFYRQKLWTIAVALPRDPATRAFVAKILLAFLPAACVGLASHRWIVRTLFAPLPVAGALAVGGIAMIALDRPHRQRGDTRMIEAVTWTQALAIGCVQVLSLWPGMSRSGATIIGAMLVGLTRSAALEFSFFLAMPTLGAASVFSLWGSRAQLAVADVPVFACGLGVSFVASLLAIAGLLRYVRSNDLRPFGWYRLVLAALIVASVLTA